MKRLLVAFTILLTMALLLSWHRKKEAERSDQETEAKKVLQSDFEKISRITVQNSSGTVTLEKRKKDKEGVYQDIYAVFTEELRNSPDWMVVSPFMDLPDPFAMDQFITSLKSLSITKVIADKKEDLAQYGLKEPSLQIKLYGDSSEIPMEEIHIGGENVSGSGLYAWTQTKPSVLLVDNGFRDFRQKTIKDWRKKQIIGFRDSSNIEEIHFSTLDREQEKKFTLRQSASRWSLVEPKVAEVDKEKVEKFLQDLDGIRALDYVSGTFEKDAKKYNLEKPMTQIRIRELNRESEKTLRLSTKDGKNFYMHRDGFVDIFEVRSTVPQLLNKEYWDFLLETPLNTESEPITKMSFDHPSKGESYTLERTESSWTWVGRERPKGDIGEDPFEFVDRIGLLKAMPARDWKKVEAKPKWVFELSKGEKSFRKVKIFEEAEGRYPVQIGDSELFLQFDKAEFDEIMAILEFKTEKDHER